MPAKKTFHRIALIGRSKHQEIRATLKALQQFLLKQGCQIVIEEETAKLMGVKAPAVTAHDLASHADLLIVVGGDGSLLKAAHIAAHINLPVLGVNRGSLGFLTDIYPDDLHKIAEILKGEYNLEERFLLEIKVLENEEVVFHNVALNDIVLSTATVAHMIEFDVLVNQELVCHLRADGIIIATPTGSTAYALSGGGPIIHPSLNAIVMVPMFPHTLSNRPVVIEAHSCIEIKLSGNRNGNSKITCDGQHDISFKRGSTLKISQKTKPLILIHPKDYNYFETLRAKLNWQTSPRLESK